MRIVFDANVYIAGILKPGLSRRLTEDALEGGYVPVVSETIIAEVSRKLTGRLGFSSEAAMRHAEAIRSHGLVVAPKDKGPDIVRDPDDRHVLACAAAGKASLVITLDKDLLGLKEWNGIAIVHPRSFSWMITPMVQEAEMVYRA